MLNVCIVEQKVPQSFFVHLCDLSEQQGKKENYNVWKQLWEVWM